MTSNPNPARKPYDAAPYASLRSSDVPRGDQQASPPGATPNTAQDFQSEAERLRALREALWAAFDAGPAAGLPNVLIDLTMAYTSSLRLQLNLRALSTRQSAPKAKIAAQARTNPSENT